MISVLHLLWVIPLSIKFDLFNTVCKGGMR